MRRLLFLLALLPAAAPAVAGRDVPLAVTGVRLLTMAGPETGDGVLVIEGGKIRAAGPAGEVEVPPGADVIDARGMTAMPGLVDPASDAGLTGQRSGGGNTPWIGPLAGLDPSAADLRAARRAGYTTLVLTREGAGVPGTGAAIRTAGARVEDLLLLAEANLRATGGTGTQTVEGLRAVFDAARKEVEARAKYVADLEAYRKALAEHEAKVEEARKKGEKPPEAPKDLKEPAAPKENEKGEAVRRAVRGEIPLLARLGSAPEVVHFAEVVAGLEKLRVVAWLAGGDSVRIVSTVAERKWSAVLAPSLQTVPFTRDLVNVAADLERAKVPFAFTAPRDPADVYLALALLVRAGLGRDAALRAVTAEAARLSGLEGRVGTLEKGKDANVVLLDGDPLDAGTRVARVILEGRTVWPEESAR